MIFFRDLPSDRLGTKKGTREKYGQTVEDFLRYCRTLPTSAEEMDSKLAKYVRYSYSTKPKAGNDSLDLDLVFELFAP